jgi:hypothetical protein
MKNATVAALVYEFLFEVYRKLDHDRKNGFISSHPDENGTMRDAFYTEGSGRWEWPAGALIDVGVLKPLHELNPPRWTIRKPGPSHIFFYPVMSLSECETTDFSMFETFDNYCVAMFSFEYLHSHFAFDGQVNLDIRSPRFLESVASQDDIFCIEADDQVGFDDTRYPQKVIARWRGGLDYRRIVPKAEG